MNKILPIFKYLLKSSCAVILIGFFNVLFNAVITDWIFFFTARQSGYDWKSANPALTMTFEYTTAIYMFVICLIAFIPGLKIALANGISRRTYFWANLPAICVMSAVFAVWNILVVLAHRPFVQVIQFSEWVYPDTGLASSLLLPFCLSLAAGVLGWLISLAYYRADNTVRWIISLAPFTLLGMLIVLNVNSDGRLFEGLSHGYRVIMGTAAQSRNPFIAVLTLSCLIAVIYAIIYLILRRTPLRD